MASFGTVISDPQTTLSCMLFFMRSGIQTVATPVEDFPNCLADAVLDAILLKQITPGEYKALFGNFADLSEKILDLQTECKKTVYLAYKSAMAKEGVAKPTETQGKAMKDNMMQQFDNFETVSTFLEKAERDNPDAICSCSSVSCTETHAE
jgi:hypothetical protein